MYGFCNGPAFSSGEGKFEGFSRFSMFFRSFEHQDRFPIVFSQTKCVWGPLRKCTDPYESIPSAFPFEIMRFPHFPNRFSKISVIKSISIGSVTLLVGGVNVCNMRVIYTFRVLELIGCLSKCDFWNLWEIWDLL